MTDDDLARLRTASPRALTHHIARPPREIVRDLANATPADLAIREDGRSAWLATFEARIANELGKEAALFFPTGTMAQEVALRVWCDGAQNRTVAFHPTCHLERDGSRGYALLHDLRAIHVGAPSRLMTLADVRAINDRLGAFLIELPQREIGGLLPPWNDLMAVCAAARRTGASLHLDGARLWESAPYYDRSHAEIASLFDSVYVSFTKGLGAVAGAMLAGDADFIAQARAWQHRQGGALPHAALFALSASLGFERNRGKMRAFRDRASALAKAFAQIDGVVPNVPQTNAFHVFLRGEKDALEARAHAYAADKGTFVFGRLGTTPVPGIQRWEFVVGDATMQLTVAEVAAAVRDVVDGARAAGDEPAAPPAPRRKRATRRTTSPLRVA